MVRITGGDCEELTVTSAYLPCDADEPPPTKGMKGIISNSSLGAMPMHTFYRGSTALIPEVQTLLFTIKAMNILLWRLRER
jgi:hypothetical protein